MAAVVAAVIVLLGIIEENDMKKLNNLFRSTDLNNKYQVMNYLTQLQAKPAWRVCLMVAFGGGYVLSLLYRFLHNIPIPLYFLIMIAFIWILSCAAHSYWGYHCVLPNGSEDVMAAICRSGPAVPNVVSIQY